MYFVPSRDGLNVPSYDAEYFFFPPLLSSIPCFSHFFQGAAAAAAGRGSPPPPRAGVASGWSAIVKVFPVALEHVENETGEGGG